MTKKDFLITTSALTALAATFTAFFLGHEKELNLTAIIVLEVYAVAMLGLLFIVSPPSTARVTMGNSTRTVFVNREQQSFGDSFGEGYCWRVRKSAGVIVYERYGMWNGSEPAEEDYETAWRILFDTSQN